MTKPEDVATSAPGVRAATHVPRTWRHYLALRPEFVALVALVASVAVIGAISHRTIFFQIYEVGHRGEPCNHACMHVCVRASVCVRAPACACVRVFLCRRTCVSGYVSCLCAWPRRVCCVRGPALARALAPAAGCLRMPCRASLRLGVQEYT